VKRPIVILFALAFGLLTLWLYVELLAPSDIETMGADEHNATQWLMLAISVVSLLTAIVGLIQRIIELRATKAS
jgi:hypothetical protein